MKINPTKRSNPEHQPLRICINNHVLLPALIAGLGMIAVAGRLSGQPFTTLYAFTPIPCPGCPNASGARPFGGLILSGNTLYGTANIGGSSSKGTVFAVNTDGTGFATLYSFSGGTDGAYPVAELVLSSNILYGTAYSGGKSSKGTVFAVNSDGTGFTALHTFTGGSDGAGPEAGLVLSTNRLYGTTAFGGPSYNGTVFAVNTDGTGFTSVYSFTAGDPNTGNNGDGANPEYAGLTLSGTSLYGTAYNGGISGKGTVFAVNTDGTGFRNLHSFTATVGTLLSNGDGANPEGGLVLSGNILYGTASHGGSSGKGTVFAIRTDGAGFTTLHSFISSDAAHPRGDLILSGSTLYGTMQSGGSSNKGVVFAVDTDGTGFSTLYNFTGGTDGATPLDPLILSSNTLYGTALFGGDTGSGTVFGLALAAISPPQLTIAPSGLDVILTWPANAAEFVLQTSPNLDSPNSWIAATYSSFIVGGQYFVTNNISGSAQFYRLKK